MTRGLGLNNPGDIRHGAPWRGKAEYQPDQDFIAFVCPIYGLRAMARVLRTYASNDVRTIAGIGARWAPPSENDTGAWARTVAAETGFGLDSELDMNDQHTLATLLRGITRAEQGGPEPYLPCQYEDAVTLALFPARGPK